MCRSFFSNLPVKTALNLLLFDKVVAVQITLAPFYKPRLKRILHESVLAPCELFVPVFIASTFSADVVDNTCMCPCSKHLPVAAVCGGATTTWLSGIGGERYLGETADALNCRVCSLTIRQFGRYPPGRPPPSAVFCRSVLVVGHPGASGMGGGTFRSLG